MTSPREPQPSKLLLTTELLSQAKQGDPAALEALMTRYLPRLNRWASGRLPHNARSLLETHDLVHDTLLKAIQALDGIEASSPGGFQSYVRQAILNRIRDQLRWARRRAGSTAVSEDLVDQSPSPLENAIGAEVLDRYERARDQLTEEERLFVHLRIELDFDYEDIAAIMNRPSRDAARMGVQRALRKLAEIMGHER
jgi:RNA polymerase sigma-70 factor (ECF subfamily)